jgi:hypothetical protein
VTAKVRRAIIPAWLANPEFVAPCYCGYPILPGQPYAIVEGQTGLKRVYHQPCYYAVFGEEEAEVE